MENIVVPVEVGAPSTSSATLPLQAKKKKSASQRRRDTAKREEQGDKFMAAENARIRKELGIGSSALFDALKDRSSESGRPIVVTSRGVGLAAHAVAKATTTFKRPVPAANVPVHELYRAGLYLFEAKLGLANRDGARLIKNANVDGDIAPVDPGLFDALAHGPWLPTNLVSLFQNLGIYEENGTTYVPRVPPVVEAGRRAARYAVPDPSNVRISNLRRTLDTLADVGTPQEVREHFFRRNPVPFIVWDANFLLTTDPATVIGDIYTLAEFRADLAVVSAWCEASSKLRDNTFAVLPEFTSKGSSVQKVLSNCSWALPPTLLNGDGLRLSLRDVEEQFWSREKPNTAEWMLAAVFAFREAPELQVLLEPWKADSERIAPFGNRIDVRDVYPVAFSQMRV